MSARNLELLKWCGLVSMLGDHVWLYVLERPTSYSEAAGSLALPLFAVAIAEGIKSQSFGSRVRTLQRLLLGAVAAQAAMLLVRDFVPVNILAGIGAGVLLDSAWRYDELRGQRVAVVLVAVAVGFVTEFGWVGVALVTASCVWARTRSDVALALAVGALAATLPYNGSLWAFAVVPVVVVVSMLPAQMPRFRGGFYWLYCLQWPLMAAAQGFVGMGLAA